MKSTPELNAGQAVAEFLNLKTPAEAQLWANKNPDFAPEGWWEYVPTDFKGKPLKAPLWQIVQKDVREAWDLRFDIGPAFMELLWKVFDPDGNQGVSWLPNGRRPMFPMDVDGGLDTAALENSEFDWHQYQRGLLYLRDHPKLMRVCVECKCPIVGGKYCNRLSNRGESCYALARQRTNQKYYGNNAPELRAARNKKYAREKTRRTARKTVVLAL